KLLIAKYNLLDDTFFSKVVEDTGAAEELIQIILGNSEIRIIRSEPQVNIRNVENKSVILDLICTDEKGDIFNVEVQRNDNDDHQKRMRYYISNIDTRFAEKGADYMDLPNIVSIMISEFDIFKLGKTVYHVVRRLDENNSLQDNGIKEIYINVNGNDDGDISELMAYMLDSNGFNAKFPRISKRVQYFKEERSGVYSMSDGIKEYMQWYAQEYAKEYAKEYGKECRAEGIAEALKVLGISKDEYEKKLAEQKQCQ
ncbi:MAG: PD-(D/E)XK nuclease family transposase, partial [Bacillota bacterium]|nr:PD-(D/E)XK nuclease family transposase [Bacillota bacterium]